MATRKFNGRSTTFNKINNCATNLNNRVEMDELMAILRSASALQPAFAAKACRTTRPRTADVLSARMRPSAKSSG